MGEEIGRVRFSEADFHEFHERLRRETALLRRWLQEGRLSRRAGVAGLELEAWLVDGEGRPAPCNDTLIARLPGVPVVPELARYNLEFNVQPRPLAGTGLADMAAELERHVAAARRAGQALGVSPLAIGTLPSLRPEDLDAAAMSPSNRYHALNEQILAARRGRPLKVDIVGLEHLAVAHCDVMLEAAATSYQLHLQMDPAQARDLYNTAQILAGPLVAVAANAPYLFGRDLWAESRIPLFEQAVEAGGYGDAAFGPLRRVGFGSGYLRHGVEALFEENLAHFPVLLPVLQDAPPERLAHLRLHNGTIWRWNRPLVGFDADGTPHLRIEHRVLPAGPSGIDQSANAALFYGLLAALAPQRLWQALPFHRARDNFYEAARLGLEARLHWPGLGQVRAPRLLDHLLPQAAEGLARLGVAADLAGQLLAVIAGRLAAQVNGAVWQRRFVRKYGRDWNALVRAYGERQASGEPVHRWPL